MRLSYSAIAKFQTCPRQFRHLYVLKDVRSEATEASARGVAVHESIEKSIQNGAPLPDELAPLQSYIDQIRSFPRYDVEIGYGTDSAFNPCSYDKGYIVGKMDVVLQNNARAVVLDWKTGKPRDNPLQLQIYAYLVFAHRPDVQEVTTTNIYIAHKAKIAPVTYSRAHIPALRHALAEACAPIELALERSHWPPKPSPLCGWCPVRSCQYHPEHAE